MSEPAAYSRSVVGIAAAIAVALAAAALAISLTACGGGENEPPARLLLEADLSELPPEADPDEAMDTLVAILKRRADSFGLPEVEIGREDSSLVAVTLSDDLPSEDARQLMEVTALLELRQPVLDENGDIECLSLEGTRLSVPRENITYATDDPGGRPMPRCVVSEGQAGEIIWEPAVGSDSESQTEDAPPVTLGPVTAVVDRTEAPVVIIGLTPLGAQILESTSRQLVGLPLGIFLDGELLAGPTIQEAIATGNLPIAGLTLNDANFLAAQLEGGPLPVPIKGSSSEGTAE